MDDVDVKGQLTREQFEKLAEPHLQKVYDPVETVIKRAGVDIKSLHSVELVGSTSRVPAI